MCWIYSNTSQFLQRAFRMKRFKITGPKTAKVFDIGDDEMIEWKILKIKDWQKREHLE